MTTDTLPHPKPWRVYHDENVWILDAKGKKVCVNVFEIGDAQIVVDAINSASFRKASEDVREEVRETLLPFISHKEDRDAATDAILPILARLQSQASGEDGRRDIASAPPSTSTRKEVMPHSPETRTRRSGQGPHNARPQQVEASAGASPPQALMRKALEALEPFANYGTKLSKDPGNRVIAQYCHPTSPGKDVTVRANHFRRARAAAEELSAYLNSQGEKA